MSIAQGVRIQSIKAVVSSERDGASICVGKRELCEPIFHNWVRNEELEIFDVKTKLVLEAVLMRIPRRGHELRPSCRNPCGMYKCCKSELSHATPALPFLTITSDVGKGSFHSRQEMHRTFEEDSCFNVVTKSVHAGWSLQISSPSAMAGPGRRIVFLMNRYGITFENNDGTNSPKDAERESSGRLRRGLPARTSILFPIYALHDPVHLSSKHSNLFPLRILPFY